MSYIGYIFRRIRYNNYTPLAAECQIKKAKIFNFGCFLAKTLFFSGIIHIFRNFNGLIATDKTLCLYLTLSLRFRFTFLLRGL